MKVKNTDNIIFLIVIFGLLSLLLRYGLTPTEFISTLIQVIDYLVMGLYILTLLIKFYLSGYRLVFFRHVLFDILLLIFLIVMFSYSGPRAEIFNDSRVWALATNLIFLRSLLSFFNILRRIKKLDYFLRSISRHPAQTIPLSFLTIIVLGTIFLMLSFSSSYGTRLSFIDSLFTATSAVCVTGLRTVDTAIRFSIWGKCIILLLIQIGGLGIMILSYFSAFVIGKRISLEEKLTLSFLLNEQDIHKLSSIILKIIAFTFIIELLGASLLFLDFREMFGPGYKAVFFSIFHAASAFCNAGFTLFTGNIEGFRSNISMNFTIAFLIITGGLSFAVLSDLLDNFWVNIKFNIFSRPTRRRKLTINSRAVLILTSILIVSGTLIIYEFEHRHILLPLDLKTQYLSAFFQSVRRKCSQ